MDGEEEGEGEGVIPACKSQVALFTTTEAGVEERHKSRGRKLETSPTHHPERDTPT